MIIFNFWVGFSYDIDGKSDYEGDMAEELHVISSGLDNGLPTDSETGNRTWMMQKSRVFAD